MRNRGREKIVFCKKEELLRSQKEGFTQADTLVLPTIDHSSSSIRNVTQEPITTEEVGSIVDFPRTRDWRGVRRQLVEGLRRGVWTDFQEEFEWVTGEREAGRARARVKL